MEHHLTAVSWLHQRCAGELLQWEECIHSMRQSSSREGNEINLVLLRWWPCLWSDNLVAYWGRKIWRYLDCSPLKPKLILFHRIVYSVTYACFYHLTSCHWHFIQVRHLQWMFCFLTGMIQCPYQGSSIALLSCTSGCGNKCGSQLRNTSIGMLPRVTRKEPFYYYWWYFILKDCFIFQDNLYWLVSLQDLESTSKTLWACLWGSF